MIFYLHIPKTGGTTLARRLASAFLPGDAAIQLDLRFPQDSELLRSMQRTKQFVASHVTGELLQDVAELDVLVTIREPVAQMISNYRHIRRKPANIWHRPAKELAPQQFFETFGDSFADHQTRCLVSAFQPGGNAILRLGYHTALQAGLSTVLDSVRWLIPTEAIDEFVPLWAMETKHRVPNSTAVENVAPEDHVDVAALRTVILSNPHLYAFDALLWQIARARFSQYREAVHEALVPWTYPADSRRAFSNGGSGVWLTKNWIDPETLDTGLAWWAGPDIASRVRFIRGRNEGVLSFDVIVVNGIGRDEIDLYRAHCKTPLSVSRVACSDDCMRYIVPLAGLAAEDEIVIVVPNAMAPIMVDATNPSLSRRSFLATNWLLSD